MTATRGAQLVTATHVLTAVGSGGAGPALRAHRIEEKHKAVWGAVGEVVPQEPKFFLGPPGPTYVTVDKEAGTRGQKEQLLAQKTTKLFFFMKFFKFSQKCISSFV